MNKAVDLLQIIQELNDSFIRVNGRRFAMGGTSEQFGLATSAEKPVHIVSLVDYAISKYPVTQKLWYAIMGNNPSVFRNEENPVENVSWYDCKAFIEKLNKITGKQYGLPTEAQWKFAARGGARSKKRRFSGSNVADEVAWTNKNSEGIVLPVGMKKSNELGIYDMSGNIWEWCEDCYQNYNVGDHYDPLVMGDGLSKVVRGGSYDDDFKSARITFRESRLSTYSSANVGFRLVCDTSVCKVRRSPLYATDPIQKEDSTSKENKEELLSEKHVDLPVEIEEGLIHNDIQVSAKASSVSEIKRTLDSLKAELAVFYKYGTKPPESLIQAISDARNKERGELIENLCCEMEDKLDELTLNIPKKMSLTLYYEPESGLRIEQKTL